jgi:hypothetical protein
MYTQRQQLTGSNWGMGRRSYGWVLGILLGLIGGWQPGQAADFTCPAGDVACLKATITTANTNGQANTITLAADPGLDSPQGYTLTAVDNTTDGPNGLPSITSTLVITGRRGEEEPTSRIVREPSAPPFRLLHVAATGNLTLNGLILEGGLLEENLGGGLFNLGTVTLTNCALVNNVVGRASAGGGLFNRGTVTLTNSTLARNTAYGSGGGLENHGTVTLTNSHLDSNTAYSSGGGLENHGTVTLTNSTLTGNTAYSDGGGIFNNGSGARLTLTNSTLTHNTSAGNGGGISDFAGESVTLTNSTLHDNRAGGSGGGIFTFADESVTLTNSTLTHNTSAGYLAGEGGGAANGGGLANLGGTVTLTNCTLAHNTAYARGTYVRADIPASGGGITNFSGTVMLTNCTVARNTAYGDTGGGGLANSDGLTTLQHTILALNAAPYASPPSDDCVGVVTSLGTNLIGDPIGCTITLQSSDLMGDPGLDAFTEDFGLTPGHGHFPLLATSQAINVGNHVACPPTDQLGQPRVDQCDIGAIEFQPRDTTPPAITVSATPEILWLPNGKLVPVTVVGTITDADSGVDPSTPPAYAVKDEDGLIQPSGSITTLDASGRYAFTIQLQASQNGNDKDGRQYTIIVSAQDKAGNTGSAGTIVTVTHDRGPGRSIAAR